MGKSFLFVSASTIKGECRIQRMTKSHSNRTFVGDDGKKYVWKSRQTRMSVSRLFKK